MYLLGSFSYHHPHSHNFKFQCLIFLVAVAEFILVGLETFLSHSKLLMGSVKLVWSIQSPRSSFKYFFFLERSSFKDYSYIWPSKPYVNLQPPFWTILFYLDLWPWPLSFLLAHPRDNQQLPSFPKNKTKQTYPVYWKTTQNS